MPYKFLLLFLFLILLPVETVLASTTDGTVTGYAWSPQIGWINFGNTAGNIHITDSLLTGYAWNENTGWVNLGATGSGVTNNAEGTLSGKAWSQGTGWIDFSGVTISSSGVFSGTASGDNSITLVFGCTQCNIVTDWRPASARSSQSGGGQGGSGGGVGGGSTGGGPSPTPTPTPTPPPLSNPDPTPNPTPSPNPNPLPNPNPPPPSSPNANPQESSGNNTLNSEVVINAVNQATEVVKDKATEAVGVTLEKVKEYSREVKKIIQTPEGSVITKIISTTGVGIGVATATSVFVFSSSSVFELLLIPFRLLALLLAFVGLKKRKLPWGVVYDSITKQPLDPAYISLKNIFGKEVSSAISDLDGRYGFFTEPGIYRIVANKTNYVFPSVKMAGKTNDELYTNLYFGEDIEIKNLGDVIIKNIPMDPITFDWNEFAKKNKKIMKFYSQWDRLFYGFSNAFFIIGMGVAIVAFFAAPYPYNTIIAVVYAILLLLRVLGFKPRAYGFVIEKSTGAPLSFAILRIMDPASGREVTHKVTDAYGRYYCLIPSGIYYVKIEKKNMDESYSVIYTSNTINVSKKGIIKEKFSV